MKKTTIMILSAAALAACSSADQSALVTQISQNMAKANTAVASANVNLPAVCLGVDAANLAFQGAAIFDAAANINNITPDMQTKEQAVYTTLTGPSGICSAANRANPPANMAAAARVAVSQVMAFLPASTVASIQAAAGHPVTAPAPVVVPVSAPQ